MDPAVIGAMLIPIAGMVTGVVVVTALGRVVLRWIERHYDDRKLQAGGGSEEIEALRSRVEELEALGGRVQDLEERLDFTERVLSQERDRQRLAPGA